MRDLGPGAAGLPPRRGAELSVSRCRSQALARPIERRTRGSSAARVRDRLLGRADRRLRRRGRRRRRGALARALGRRGGGHAFALSEAFGGVAGGRARSQLAGRSAAARRRDDRGGLGQRDLTINAIAEPLGGGELVDPFGGLADLDARPAADGVGRTRSPAIRCGRCGSRGSPCELDFAVEPDDGGGAAPQRARARRGRARADVRRAEADRRRRAGARGAGADGRARRDRGGAAGAGRPARRRAEPLPPPRRLRPHAGGAGRDDRARARSRRGVLGEHARGRRRACSPSRSPTS